MNIAVVGAGAMGSMFGALLHRGGHEVVLVDVDETQVDAINRSDDWVEGRAAFTEKRAPMFKGK